MKATNHQALKLYFKQYLTEVRGVSPRTVAHYNTSLRTVERYLREAGKLEGSIYDVDSLVELLALREFLMTLPVFVAQDVKGNRMYTAGLNRYIEFATDANADLAKPAVIEKLDIPIASEVAPRRRSAASFAWVRDRIIVQQALASAEFLCGVNPSHTTFIAEASNRNYLEGHHLIPLSQQATFANSLDIYANIVGLCPNCHRFLHLARRADRQPILSSLYTSRVHRLAQSGIAITHDAFLATTMG